MLPQSSRSAWKIKGDKALAAREAKTKKAKEEVLSDPAASGAKTTLNLDD